MGLQKRAYVARAEACPLPLDKLTAEQAAAREQVVQLLEDMATRKWEGRKQAPLFGTSAPVLDENWWNNVILIEGRRGTGKTTLFLSLLREWKYPEDPQSRLCVPLSIIDMHTLPPDTNLLHLIGQCLRRLIDDLEASDPTRTPPRSQSEPKLDTPRQHWERFSETVARTWNANLENRKSLLDPEDYNYELDEAERHRLMLSHAFFELVESLEDRLIRLSLPAKQRPVRDRPDHRRPLIVIPIDDSDMNPEHTYNLLKMFRLLWHPRVAYLLTGHSELFLASLRSHFLGALYHGIGGFSPDMRRGMMMTADHVYLADEMFRRAIPPGHRCTISTVALADRTPLLWGPRPVDGPRPPDSEMVRNQLEAYFTRWPALRHALPGTRRRIEDLRLWLAAEPRTLQSLLCRLWEEASYRAVVSQDQQRKLRRAIRIELRGADSKPVFEVIPHVVQWTIEYTKIDDHLLNDRACTAQRTSAYYTSATDAHDVNDARVLLEFEMTVILLLGMSVAATLADSRIVGVSPVPGGFANECMLIRKYSRSLKRDVECAWPLPNWQSFHDMERFGCYWEAVVREHPLGSQGLETTARYFLHGILELAATRALDNELTTPTEPPPWADLVKRMATLVEQGGKHPREVAFAHWAQFLAPLLATPECGLDPSEAKEFLAKCDNDDDMSMKGHVHELASQRRLMLQTALTRGRSDSQNSDIDALLAELDEDIDHPWNMFERRPKNFRDLGDLLALFTMYAPEHSFHLHTQVLHEYVPDGFVALLQRSKYHGPLLVHLGELVQDDYTLSDAGTALGLVWHALLSDGASRDTREAVSLGADQTLRVIDLFELRRANIASLREGPRTAKLYDLRASPQIKDGATVALYNLVWNIAADTHDSDGQAPNPPGGLNTWWGGLLVTTPGVGLEVPWIGVAWPAERDVRQMTDAWRQHAYRAAHRRGTMTAALDQLAVNWLDTAFNVAVSRRAPDTGPIAADADAWKQVVGELMQPRSKSYSGARWDAFAAFRAAVPLFAAPESGLSATAAAAILEHCAVDRERWPALLRLRRERLEHSGVADAAAMAERIDAAHKDHPWSVLTRAMASPCAASPDGSRVD